MEAKIVQIQFISQSIYCLNLGFWDRTKISERVGKQPIGYTEESWLFNPKKDGFVCIPQLVRGCVPQLRNIAWILLGHDLQVGSILTQFLVQM